MIEKLLVANRGEIALRVMRSARDAGIGTVAVFSDPDADSPHVAFADEAVRLPGAASAETYLRGDLIVSAALAAGADAVHPGYGFLSENAPFARACADAGLTFIGPPASVIESMGSKLAAKAIMQAAGVPVLAQVQVGTGARSDLTAEVEQAEMSYPVLVKASAGGGGRGMRVVAAASGLVSAVESARREAQSAFGDGTLFIEPYATRPRHIEVQVFGDMHGNVVHLFERECSIQRRHQKIVEESPSSALSDAMRQSLCGSAVTAAKAIGYVNAGTVEFLMLEDGSFAFLEVNTRLQVEHPVTELVTGVDLVRLQFLVAEGRPLPEEALHASLRGHAIEVRLYAEDPTNDWRPSVGELHRFRVGGGSQIRVDSGVTDGSVVSPWYDPMLAKVVAYSARSPEIARYEAARALASALAGSQLHGITTNRDLLVRILRHPEFLAGDIDTGFLVRHDPAQLGAPLASPHAEKLHAIAAAMAAQASRRSKTPVLPGLPSGWRNNASEPQKESFAGRNATFDVSYLFDRTGRCVEVSCSTAEDTDDDLVGTSCGVSVATAEPERVVIASGTLETAYSVQLVDEHVFVDGPDGSSSFLRVERFPLPGSQLQPGSLIAPLPGTVVRVEVKVGDSVSGGDVLIAIEAMKMEHEVRAGHAGVVEEVAVAPGDQVESGRLLVVVKEGESTS